MNVIRKVGFVGLGKLGLPVALSIENKGHVVCGYDVNKDVKTYIETGKIPYEEKGTPTLLRKTKLIWKDSIKEVVEFSDLIFCPVQTPHEEKYEGITRLPDKRVDFEYKYLKKAVKDIAEAAKELNKKIVLVIISTVLPGTIEREIKPLLNKKITLCYNPFFIAMGTTRDDFEKPEFVLLGCDGDQAVMDYVEDFYHTIHLKPVFRTTIKNAELIKVLYNTYITGKLSFISTAQEICDKVGANVDDVSKALSMATDRIVSMKYLWAGQHDGGGCHPRDNIALSYLARKIGLKYDWFENLMKQREAFVGWFADVVQEWQDKKQLPIILCGQAFKKDINLTVGSPNILLENILKERNLPTSWYDPIVYPNQEVPQERAIFFIGMNHTVFENMKFPENSVIIDPWGIIKDQENSEVIRLGRR
jgi:UDPglucose 6-dehydrogenase